MTSVAAPAGITVSVAAYGLAARESFSPHFIGALGILVLFSSTVRNLYRPDVHAQHARQAVAALRKVLREATDDLYALEANVEDARPLIDIRRMVSRSLDQIEENQLLSDQQDVPRRKTQPAQAR